MADAVISTMIRLLPEDMALLRKLVARRMMETGQRSSQNEIVRDLIRQASVPDATS